MAYRTGKQLTPQNLSGVTELRVHGVGGASPEQVLDVPYTDWVAGDLTAGFFTAPSGVAISGPQRRLEAYSWGGLTSRSAARALWLLLLPFALINMSGWMMELRSRPGSAEDRHVLDVVAMTALRLFGLAVTIGGVFYTAVIGIDLYAYQCGGLEACADGRWLVWPVSNGVVSTGIGPQLVVGSLIPIGVAGLVAWLTKRSQSWIHPDTSVMDQPTDVGLDTAGRLGLSDRDFWSSPHMSHRLGIGHTAAAFAAVGLMLASTVAGIEGAGVGEGYRLTFAVIILAVALAIVALDKLGAAWFVGLLVVSLSTLIGELFVVWGIDASGSRMIQAPGIRSWGGPIFGIALALLAVFALAQYAVLGRRDMTLRKKLYNWFAPAAIAFLGYGIVLAFGSGAVIQAANLFGDGVAWGGYVATPVEDMQIVYSNVNGVVAVNTAIVLVALAVGAGAIAVWRLLRRDTPAEVARDYGADPSELDQRQVKLLGKISAARAVAKVTDAAAVILVSALLVIGALAAVAFVNADFRFSELATNMPFASWQQQASALLGVLALVALFLLDRSRRSAGLRRGLGIVWDITTFWPRWFHPYAPPPYGERAVPQLALRISQIRQAGGGVVLSGHSQGTAVAVAAVAKLDGEQPDVLDRVTLITHGSPVGRLYGRFFSSYFSRELLERTVDAVWQRQSPSAACWVNLHRKTDYIGGTILAPDFSPARYDDEELDDPPDLTFTPGETLPKPLRHFEYFRDPRYAEVVEQMCNMMSDQSEGS